LGTPGKRRCEETGVECTKRNALGRNYKGRLKFRRSTPSGCAPRKSELSGPQGRDEPHVWEEVPRSRGKNPIEGV